MTLVIMLSPALETQYARRWGKGTAPFMLLTWMMAPLPLASMPATISWVRMKQPLRLRSSV